MPIKCSSTYNSVVITETIEVECSYRVTPLGNWDRRSGANGRWKSIGRNEVPAAIRDALAEFDTANGLMVA